MPNIDITALRALEQRELNLDRAIAICKAFPGLLDEVERLNGLVKHLGACEECHAEHVSMVECRDIHICELTKEVERLRDGNERLAAALKLAQAKEDDSAGLIHLMHPIAFGYAGMDN